MPEPGLFHQASAQVTADQITIEIDRQFGPTLLGSKEFTTPSDNIARAATLLEKNYFSRRSTSSHELESLTAEFHKASESILTKFKTINNLMREFNSITQPIYEKLDITTTHLFENFDHVDAMCNLLKSDNAGKRFERCQSAALTTLGVSGSVVLLSCIMQAVSCMSTTVLQCIATVSLEPVMGGIALIFLLGGVGYIAYNEWSRLSQLESLTTKINEILHKQPLQEIRASLYQSQFIERVLLKILANRVLPTQQAANETNMRI